MPVLTFALGLVISMAPARYWHRVERYADVRFCAFTSAVVTAVAASIVGAVAYVRYASATAAMAQNLTVRMAATQIRPPVDAEVTLSTAQIVSATAAIGFWLTPTGLLLGYLWAASLFRAAAVYLGDPQGDPALTLIDYVGRRTRDTAIHLRASWLMAKRFGPDLVDQVAVGALAGVPEADLVILSARAKPLWTPGLMVLIENDCFRLMESSVRRVGKYDRIVYPLVKKVDNEILRRVVRYTLPNQRGTL